MPTYRDCDDRETTAMLDTLLKRRSDLAEAGVTVSLLEAFAPRNSHGEPRGPALKSHGWPAAARIKINSQKDRVEGKADATIELDWDEWPQRSKRQQESVIHHELLHLELVRTKPKKRKVKGKVVMEGGGEVTLDDAHRPKLKLRLHDVQLGIFMETAEKYGEHSLDAHHLAGAAKALKQLNLPWG